MLAAAAMLAASDRGTAAGATRPVAAVAVVRSVPWAQTGEARAGAEELSLLIRLARLQRDHSLAGLVGVGAPHGVFQSGAERALRFAVFSGVPVLKLAAEDGDIAACPDEIFLEATGLTETEACRLLAASIEQLGAPPRAVDPARPTAAEAVAVRAHIARLQERITLARGPQLAQR